MPVNKEKYQEIKQELSAKDVQLIAVSKIQSNEDILAMYEMGQRDFGENYVQEVVEKQQALPKDINWHFIGHLQRNKVKYIVPFVHLIHGVDSFDLLKEINKQGKKQQRTIDCLLQVHLAEEETKFGLNAGELEAIIKELQDNSEVYANVFIKGLMGMASFSDDLEKVRGELAQLKKLFDQYAGNSNPVLHFTKLSMGMSGDYKIAIEERSNMVRIGSLLFGARPAK